MKFSLSTKVNGKWRTFGNLTRNDEGKFRVGLRVTPEFRALVEAAGEGEWINLAAFEERPKEEEGQVRKEKVVKPTLDGVDDEIPF